MKKIFSILIISILLILNYLNCYSENLSSGDILASYGIVNKKSSNELYRLNDFVLRQEVVGMSTKLLGFTLPETYNCKGYYTDITNDKPNTWACKSVEIASDNGVISKLNSKFRPEDKITRAEALSIIMKASKIDISSSSNVKSFSDVNIDWQIKVTNKALELGIIDGEEYFYPNQNATRGEIFEMAKRIIQNNYNLGLEKILLDGVNSNDNSSNSKKTAKKIEISDLMDGVVSITCSNSDYSNVSSGSAFFMNVFGGYYLFTNFHVFNGSDKCYFAIESTGNSSLNDRSYEGNYQINVNDVLSWNNFTDFGAFKLTENNYMFYQGKDSGTSFTDKAKLENLNYNISKIQNCSNNLEVGTDVYTVGFPLYGEYSVYYDSLKTNIKKNKKIVSNGIISGMHNIENYDKYNNKIKKYPFDNYFISNKVDSGNSGGPTFSKENGNFCLLGIVTWLTEGEYETQGIVQNINNIYYTDNNAYGTKEIDY